MSDDGDEFKHVAANYWKLTRERAERGDTDAARDLLDAALGAIELGRELDPDVQEFLVGGLRDLLNNVPTKDAFFLTGQRGRPADQNIDRNVKLAATVIVVMRERGLSKTKASEQAMIDFGEQWNLKLDEDTGRTSDRTFLRAFNRYSEELQKLDTDLLRQIALK